MVPGMAERELMVIAERRCWMSARWDQPGRTRGVRSGSSALDGAPRAFRRFPFAWVSHLTSRGAMVPVPRLSLRLRFAVFPGRTPRVTTSS